MKADRYRPHFDEQSGLRFEFKIELDQPSLLHIFVRHGTTPKDAIDTFFRGETSWDELHKRFETLSRTHGLYWAWRVENSVVLVISCFKRKA